MQDKKFKLRVEFDTWMGRFINLHCGSLAGYGSYLRSPIASYNTWRTKPAHLQIQTTLFILAEDLRYITPSISLSWSILYNIISSVAPTTVSWQTNDVCLEKPLPCCNFLTFVTAFQSHHYEAPRLCIPRCFAGGQLSNCTDTDADQLLLRSGMHHLQPGYWCNVGDYFRRLLQLQLWKQCQHCQLLRKRLHVRFLPSTELPGKPRTGYRCRWKRSELHHWFVYLQLLQMQLRLIRL
jgi:hypothetical protein